MMLPGTTAVLALVDQAGGDVAESLDAAQGFADDLVDALPRVGVALAVMVVAIVASRLTRRLLEPRLTRARTPSFGAVMAKLVGWTIVVVGALVAATIGFPSIQPVDLIASLGIISIAAGFAFQDILSNLLSGLLLILRQPFVSGDQIEVDGHHGIVQAITIRETQIRTFDGHEILIPNKDVYQSAIDVQTAYEAVRTSLVVGCSYDDDLAVAEEAALAALAATEGVLDRPGPEAYFIEFGDSTINLDLRYWTDPHQAEIRRVRHRVVMAVKRAFDQAGLDIPFPIRTVLDGSAQPTMS